MMKLRRLVLAAGLAANAVVANAESSVTVYGLLDEYANYMHSSSGTTIKAFEDGAWFTSRIGFRGVEDLGDNYFMRFQLESGLNVPTGTAGDTTRFFNRQSWVGVAAPYGEARVGRQNSPIFIRGCNIDFGCRSSGSIVNTFGVPARFDNVLSVIGKRTYGVLLEGQVSLPETALFGNHPLVFLAAADWKNDTFAVGYAGMRARPPANAPIDKDVVYDNFFANWMYGKGTIYLTYVHSNNNTPSGGINNAGTIVSGAGGFNPGTNPDLNHFYDIYQISADYQVTGLLRVGAIWGKIDDKSGRQRGLDGGSVGAYYSLSKRTTLMATLSTLHNETNGGWRPNAAGAIKNTFVVPGDVNGQKINQVQLGVAHSF
jgi:predicted porin